jgi:predicted nucleic acid-binding protein
LPLVEISRDPADNFLLSMAQAGKADFLVTGDKHDLLSVVTFERTRIVSARQMLEEVKPQRKRRSKSTGRGHRSRRRARVARLS